MDKATIITGAVGFGMLLVGGVMALRNRPSSGSGAEPAGTAGMLGRGRVAQAPIVGSYSDGNMQTRLRASKDMPIEQRVATIQDLIHKSVQDPEMRKHALAATRGCAERDQLCEAKAIYHFVKARVRYTGDVGPIVHPDGSYEGIDLYQSARRTLEFGGGDCLPAGTLLLVEGHRLVPIEDLIIGAKIWGRDSWTEVKNVWSKGILPVDLVHMNNGSSFMATGDHKAYVAICPSHPHNRSCGPCSCPIEARSIERIKITQLEPNMVLVQPDKIAFGTETMDPRRAYVEGLFASDGWKSHENDFDIAGRDRHPKEAQKREVAEICAALGYETTWFNKSIRVRDRDWAARMGQMGERARFKHVLTINLDEASAAEMLRGIMADSGANTHGNGRTFTSTSRQLMLQTRVLQRMFGRSCSERFIVDHGGEGEHPIHRLGVRDTDRSDGHSVKLLRVKEIDRAIGERRVFDISTADHYVYLPEADVIVSNCDDNSILNATLLALNGIEAKLRIVRQKQDPDWSHIYTVAVINGKDIPLDTTLPGDKSFNYEVRTHKQIDFPA